MKRLLVARDKTNPLLAHGTLLGYPALGRKNMARVGDLTVEELKALLREILEQVLEEKLGGKGDTSTANDEPSEEERLREEMLEETV